MIPPNTIRILEAVELIDPQRTKFKVAVAVVPSGEGISERLYVIEVCRIQSEGRCSVGNKPALGKDFASKKVEIKVIIFYKKR